MPPFHVGLSGGLFGKDGQPCFDSRILADLRSRPDIVTTVMDASKTEITADDARRFDAVYLMLEQVKADVIDSPGRRLRLAARHGVGFDTVDVAGMADIGVMVTNTPEAVRRPVASMALTLLLALSHKLILKHNMTRAGRWAENADHMGLGLTGKRLGLLGAGSIGCEILRMVRVFDMHLAAADPYVSAEDLARLDTVKCDTDTLFAQSDFIIIATALTTETFHLVDAEKLALMKPGAAVINVARGPVIDEAALITALQNGHLGAAALDVFEQEPVDPANPLLFMDNVITTSHSLCWTDECFANIARDGLGSIHDFMDKRPPHFIVNRTVLDHPLMKGWFAK